MDKSGTAGKSTSGKTTKKQILSLLSRRSTKIEPQCQENDSCNINGSHTSTSSASNLIKNGAAAAAERKNITSLINSNSSQSNHSENETSNLVKEIAVEPFRKQQPPLSKLYNKNNNRLTGQFNFCCTNDDRSATPPVSVHYNQLYKNGNKSGRDNLRLELTNTNEPLRTVIDEVPRSGKEDTGTQTSPAGQSTSSYPMVQHRSFDKKPVFSEYQSSIAMTACRSRLRQKLLPPGNDTDNSSNDALEMNFSSPNLTQPQPEHRNSRSFSYDALITGNPIVQRPASTDSLARQALIAAQVLNLIPTEKARERSFLHGRLSYNSLLGGSELDKVLPSREVKIYIGSWNMNGQNPPKQMNDFVLPLGIDHVPDIIVIGTQESCSERFEWEVILQETLGPSHILLHSATLGTLHLAVFIRRDLIWFCSLPEDDSLSVRPGTAFRTKGAVAISFCLFGTSMLFVTSHLTAHQQKVKERVQDIKRIIHSLDLPRNYVMRHKSKDVTQNFDSVFWCGDLNFRLGEPREKLLEWIENTKFPLPPHLPHGYMHTDQLRAVLSDGAAFKGFREANISFPPTYKYDPGTQNFDTSSKQRAPAYTDRILYKYRTPTSVLRRGSEFLTGTQVTSNAVECIAYDSVPSIVTSDHKPVWALFKNSIRPGLDSMPLAAGLFNRDVYIEGMKRRLNNTNASSSAVCIIQ